MDKILSFIKGSKVNFSFTARSKLRTDRLRWNMACRVPPDMQPVVMYTMEYNTEECGARNITQTIESVLAVQYAVQNDRATHMFFKCSGMFIRIVTGI